MGHSNSISVTAKLKTLRYSSPDPENHFFIGIFEVIDAKGYDLSYSEPFDKLITVKGNGEPITGVTYKVSGTLEHNNRFGDQYQVYQLPIAFDLTTATKEQVRTFLGSFISKSLTNAIVDGLPNPGEVLVSGTVEELSQIKGIGATKGESILNKVRSQLDYSAAIVALKDFGFNFSPKVIQKVVQAFKSPEGVASALNTNPYLMTRVPGIGFLTVDKVAIKHGIQPNDSNRVRSYIQYYLQEERENGNSYVEAKDFVVNLNDKIYGVDIPGAIEYINKSPLYSVYQVEDEMRISLSSVNQREQVVAKELKRLVSFNGKMGFKSDLVERAVAHTEDKQGFKYSKIQRAAIDEMVDNNVYLLQGLSGSGKSSSIAGFVNALREHHFSFTQVALSGKAANNLEQITGEEGSTIHRRLKIMPDQKGKYFYGPDQRLEEDVIILDELSMVDLDIFYALISAIKDGGKLIMIGDIAQLESIGISVMRDFLTSNVVPTRTLDEIHRQAQKSAIITHSIQIRGGIVPDGLAKSPGTVRTYGELQDLTYSFVRKDGEQDSILHESIRIYKELLKEHKVDDIQILIPTKKGLCSTFTLNKAGQALVTPHPDDKSKLTINQGKENEFELHVGDRVINVKNNTKTPIDDNGNPAPIFNGNTGVVLNLSKGEIKIYFDGIGIVNVLPDHFKYIELGYAITIHKSQGSTIPYVIVAYPFNYMLNSRESLYTAITRASKHCWVVSSPSTFVESVKKTASTQHNTSLDYYIKREFR